MIEGFGVDFLENRRVGKQSQLLIKFLYENEGNLKFQARRVLVWIFRKIEGLENKAFFLFISFMKMKEI